MITAEQLAQLQEKVADLVEDKRIADEKTQISNTADAAAVTANAQAAQAKLEEQSADQATTDAVTGLRDFIDNLSI